MIGSGKGRTLGISQDRPPLALTIRWEELTPPALETLRLIAVPISLGYSETEVAQMLEVRPSVVRRRLIVLRSELLNQEQE